MNAHALAVLEFPRLLDLVAGYASSAAGAERIRQLAPAARIAALEVAQTRAFAMVGLVECDAPWVPYPIPDVHAALERLAVPGAVLPGSELLELGTLLRSTRLTHAALGDVRKPAVSLATFAPDREALVPDRALEDAVERTIDSDGTVRDDASGALKRLRRSLRSAEGELIALLERTIARLAPHERVADMSVTVRNGRYVIPVRRDSRSSLGGIVHDTSASGATLFVEPPAAIEACNRIRELEGDEAREVERLLRELSAQLHPHGAALTGSLDALTTLDALFALARFALVYRCTPVDLVLPGTGFHVVAGRHPLLAAQQVAVVPFDLRMAAEEHTLLVSGPNTGGKTVLLKSIGLFAAMVQAGIPIPVARGTSIPVFDDTFADVGDEQSIEASLSTFSAHLKNLAEVLRSATAQSLVLIDELGSGTDPLEGAALGGAILEELTRRGALTLATTHLGALKELATEVPGVVNASLQFDAVALAPTYMLIKGIPGRSYGLSIARRLGLPAGVLARAEERVPGAERDVNALLAALEAREKELTVTEKVARESQESARELTLRLAEREGRVGERERAVERESRREARRYLLEARGEVERTIRELRRQPDEDAAAAAVRSARQHVEQLAADQERELDRLEEEDLRSGATTVSNNSPFVSGDTVEMTTMPGRVGRLLERRGEDWLVAVGAVKLAFPVAVLRKASASHVSPLEVVPVRGDLPELEAPTEIDLRGLRADEMDDVLLQGLDLAIRADLRLLRIIHGKGTGALRERVAGMLRKDTRVKGFRLGAWNEGGAGVTIAEL